MTLAIVAVLVGLAALVWSADRFIEGAAATASIAGMPPLLVGMIIVGFGTSAPEMVVSAMAALDGKPDLALGNALGSNIANIGLIVGLTALIAPLAVHSSIVRKELPLLLVIGLLAGALLWDGMLSRAEALVLLAGFLSLVGWSIWSGLQARGDVLAAQSAEAFEPPKLSLGRALLWLGIGLVVLTISSRVLVWGAVNIAAALGVSDLIIGLTIVAIGTSLPELASSLIAARKGEHDMAIGNIVGSNMFNLLAVIGIAGVISPMTNIAAEALSRDWTVMMVFTVALLIMGWGMRGEGRVNRLEGTLLLTAFVGYTGYLVFSIWS